jgi:hypothetical protein
MAVIRRKRKAGAGTLAVLYSQYVAIAVLVAIAATLTIILK